MSIFVIWVPEGKKKTDTGKKNTQTMTENFPNLVRDTTWQIEESKQNPNKINSKKTEPRHWIIKLLQTKNKKKILK